jgi:flagellar hook assembly protein FlgD
VGNGRGIEVSSNYRCYWVSDVKGKRVCKVLGFYPSEQGVEEEIKIKEVVFKLKSNPTHFPVTIRVTPIPKKRGIKIYSIAGRLVREVEINEKGEIIWNGYDTRGEKVKNGIYFLKIARGKNFISQKIIIVE